jgi:N-methylhydantoinase A
MQGEDALSPERLETLFAPLESAALAEMCAEGIPAGQVTLSRWLDMRYRGQSYEISIPGFFTDDVEAARLRATRAPVARGGISSASFVKAFHAAHREAYGYADPAAPVELVHVRLRARGHVPHPELPRAPARPAPPPAASDRRRVYLSGWTDTPLFFRDHLPPGVTFAGPALVAQEDSTTLLPPGWVARVDEGFNLVMERA